MKIKAFTLTELLIALAVIGILIAILLPVVFGLLPNQNALMAKRAYYAIQTVVGDLMNDEACYPDKTQAVYPEARVGLDDGYGYADCLLWGGKYNEDYINNEDADSKFLTLFTNKLDLKSKNGSQENEDNETVVLNGASTYSFTTKDGIVWTAKNMHLSHVNEKPYIDFELDLNGADGPNCKSPADDSGNKCHTQKDFDKFTVRIYANGSTSIIEHWASQVIGINADITKGYEE